MYIICVFLSLPHTVLARCLSVGGRNHVRCYDLFYSPLQSCLSSFSLSAFLSLAIHSFSFPDVFPVCFCILLFANADDERAIACGRYLRQTCVILSSIGVFDLTPWSLPLPTNLATSYLLVTSVVNCAFSFPGELFTNTLSQIS